MKRYVMEFLGTFFFVFTIAMTSNPLAAAIMLMAWLYIGGHISGGHYNPLVSLAVAMRGRLAWDILPFYMLSQIAAGAAAFGLSFFFHDQIMLPHPGEGISLLEAGVIEVLLSFVLGLVVLMVATSRHYAQSQIFGVAIGLTIFALAALGSPISGGLFNPAISVGAAIVGLLKGMPIMWAEVFMYVIGSLLGGALASYAFNYFMHNEA